MGFTCVIVDDEQPARKLLEEFVSRIPGLESKGSFKSPLDASEIIRSEQVDMLFLDIQMPDMKGTSFIKTLTHTPEIILTTAYPEYAIEGFELNVLDYLLKPFSFDRFMMAVNKAFDQINLKAAPTKTERTISIHAAQKFYKVKSSEILYIEGLKEYVSYYTQDGQRIVALQSMSSIEKEFEDLFLRVHRSYIINPDKISYVEGNSVMIGDKRIPIGGSYQEKVKPLLMG